MWYIHQTCTNCSSWHDLLRPRGGLCPWPTFYAWVTMVRKKWLSPYYSTYWCYIHQTCTNCSSWHYLLIPCGGLCPWPTFQASVTKTQNGWSGAPVMVPITIMSSLSLRWKELASHFPPNFFLFSSVFYLIIYTSKQITILYINFIPTVSICFIYKNVMIWCTNSCQLGIW